MDKAQGNVEHTSKPPPDSTTAENIRAWNELLGSKETKESINTILDRLVILSGKAPQAQMKYLIYNCVLMTVAFICIGALAYLKLIPDGTIGVLSGIIIGYFFKREWK